MLRLPVWRLWPGCRDPTWLISGQVVCTRLSLFTNVTREPAATVTERGDTPLDVMVIVVSVVGGALESALGSALASRR